MARVGKVPSATAAVLTATMVTPDNANYVLMAYESDSDKFVIKNSAGVQKRSAALA